MKKLRLELDELAVESFAANERDGSRGTVAGREFTQYADECVTPNGTCERGCWDGTVAYSCAATCQGSCASCQGTCGASCAGTCAGTCGASCFGTCAGCTGVTDCGCGTGQTYDTCPGAPICT